MFEAGELLASGREADIFEYRPGLVLRRSRSGHSQQIAARVMQYLGSFGYPVPTVLEVSDDGRDMVTERVDGTSMGDEMARHPWRLNRYADQLADLHQQLRGVPKPSWSADLPVRPGRRDGSAGPTDSQAASGHIDTLLHLDLHPLNVMMTSKGPVVIDWTNVSSGHWADDVAMSWLLMSSAEIPGRPPATWLMGALRRRFVERYLRTFDIDEVKSHLGSAADWKYRDPNMHPAELARIRELVVRASP
ncbi:MAG: phosphotransferase [Microthrixaceae bacterium]